MSRWFRFYDDALNDKKVQSLSPALFKAWVNLLCVASKNGGPIGDVEAVAFALRLSEPKAQSVIIDLRKAGLLDEDGGEISPHNWGARQYKSDDSSDRVKKYRDKRRASGLPVVGDYNKFRKSLASRDGEVCVYCRSTEQLVVDHMVPVALGGTDDIDNLALACRSCNAGKAGRTPKQSGKTIIVKSAAEAHYRYRDRHINVTVTDTVPEQKQITEQKDVGEGAREPLVSPTAYELADNVMRTLGVDLEFIPPGWCGAAMRLQSGLAEGWNAETVMVAVRKIAANKRDGPPDTFRYLEKAIAREHALAAQPIPKVEIRAQETTHVYAGPRQAESSLVAAGRKRVAELDKIIADDEARRSAQDQDGVFARDANVLLLPQGGRGGG